MEQKGKQTGKNIIKKGRNTMGRKSKFKGEMQKQRMNIEQQGTEEAGRDGTVGCTIRGEVSSQV